jgi:hypothetical protein
MALQKLVFKPGVNREITRYSSETGWYESDKIRFRQGMPEKIGGWERISDNTFLGTARSLHCWRTLDNSILTGVGTHLKFYIEQGGVYYDVTPLSVTRTLTNPFTTVNGSTTVTVTDSAGEYTDNGFVTFSGASAVGGLTLNGEFQISFTSGNTYTITASEAASSSATGGGTVSAAYQINVGPETQVPLQGWGAGTWGEGTWGNGGTSTVGLREWSQSNFGEDLIFGAEGGALFIWDASDGITTRATLLSAEGGASDVPTVQNQILVSDNRFVFCFGANTLGTSVQDPMLIRWSDQENSINWTPAATNQAGDLTLSRGSQIITGSLIRQEVLVWTDSALYALQYVGAPVVWGSQLIGENISIMSRRSVIVASDIAYWMGRDKFYIYDGSTKPLPCTVKRYVFSDINFDETGQIFAGANEEFSEVWWFYPTANSLVPDRYVIYNYAENLWYYGNLSRTAWLDSGIKSNPIATTNNKIVQHEVGLNDAETSSPVAITSSITSAQFDLDDGDRFMLISRLVPDVTFEGSVSDNPAVTMSFSPFKNSGSGENDPASESGNVSGTITRTVSVPVEKYTGQVFLRVRGRQASFKIESTDLDVTWQLGSPRMDMRPDGRR